MVKEGAIAATLTSLMILLFLGSWRSTVIIALSIPLAILFSVAALSAAGETLNIMTLGGLALAVGILVDDATVTIENINYHLELGKPVRQAILDGAEQIVGPAFVSLLCICIAFVPMFFLPGISGFLFAPMAEAVVFAMIGSFILSRTLVPTMANYLLRDHGGAHGVAVSGSHDAMSGRPASRNPLRQFQHGFEQRFEGIRRYYVGLLEYALVNRPRFLGGFAVVVLLSFLLVPLLGRNFFPSVDSGAISMHVRAPVGTRIEETAALFDHIEDRIRQVIPPDQIVSIVDNIGLPVSGINRAYSNTGGVGPQDGDILVTLVADHRPTPAYVARLREALPQSFPGSVFSFLPADIVSQILNFGAPAPIDLQVAGPDTGRRRSLCPQAGGRDGPHRRHRRRPRPAVVDLSAAQLRCRSDAGRPRRHHRARRYQQPVGQSRRQLPERAGLLAQPEERCVVPDRRADAAVPDRFGRADEQHPGHRQPPGQLPDSRWPRLNQAGPERRGDLALRHSAGV